MPIINMNRHIPALVHRRLHRRPRESAINTKNVIIAMFFTTPYMPVAKSDASVPLRPRFLKI